MNNSEKITRQYEQTHLRSIKGYQKQLHKQYLKAIDKIFAGASTAKMVNNSFSIDKNPVLKKLMDSVLTTFQQEVNILMINGIDAEWDLAESKMDAVISNHLSRKKISETAKEALFSRRTEAKEAFKKRTTGKDGLGLSDRVWNYNNQFRNEIEQNLFVGISEGKSAAAMASEQKKYLKEPDKLFRRVRDADGKLVLSKEAKLYKPGQGIYRSSYKNAMRTTRTETNMAYRTADGEKYAKTKFILGFEVKLSYNHPRFDVCDHLAGKYPSDFKFMGWHPQCLCFTVPVLPSMEEYDKYEDSLLEGKGDQFQFKKPINEVPSGFNKYIKDNEEMLGRLKSTPYWIRDNFNKGDLSKGLKFDPIKGLNTPIIKAPSAPKTNIDLNDFIKGDTPTNKEIKNILLQYAEINPDNFRNGLGEVKFLKSKSYLMQHSANYRTTDKVWIGKSDISISTNTFLNGTFNPAEEIRSAFAAIKKGKELTFNQEYSIESLWHEVLHAKTKTLPSKLTISQTKAMETVNQFVARHTYDDFLKSFGGKAVHKNSIMENGYGYKSWITDFREKLKLAGISETTALNELTPILMSNYRSIEFELLKFFNKHKK